MRADWNGLIRKAEILTDIITKGTALYWFWKERRTVKSNPDDPETTDNEQFYKNS